MKAASRIPALSLSPLLLLLFIPLFVTPAAAQSELALPKWKIEGAVGSSYYGTGIGVYRRVGQHWDLGLFVDGSVSLQDDDASRLEQESSINQSNSTGDDDGFSIGLNPELRHWNARTDRLRTFCGARIGAGYSWDDNRSSSQQLLNDQLFYRTERYTRLGRSVRAGIVMGAEWEVTRNLGLAGKLAPLTFAYGWVRYNRESNSTPAPFEGAPTIERSVERSNDFSMQWNLYPSLVASINF